MGQAWDAQALGHDQCCRVLEKAVRRMEALCQDDGKTPPGAGCMVTSATADAAIPRRQEQSGV